MSKALPTNLQPYFDELKYWNHGDNPAFKKFMKVGMENTRGKELVDHRTHVLDRGVRLSLSRNFDDILQRDMKVVTFPRALSVWILSSMFLFTAQRITSRLIPIGRFGIKKINETQFYQNFGWIGVAGAGAYLGFAAYAWWKVTRFTAHKFYRHVIQQNRNWFLESLQVSRYGNYFYPESILTREDDYHKSQDKKIMMSLPKEEFVYQGPYSIPKSEKKTDSSE